MGTGINAASTHQPRRVSPPEVPAYASPMIPFAKYSGAGNDFVLLPEEAAGRGPDPSSLARRICPRESGVGVDGMVLVRPAAEARWEIRFFNPDGSEFHTCGNGSRCAARYLVDEHGADRRHRLVTADGEMEAEVGEEGVGLLYHIDARVVSGGALETPSGTVDGWLVRVGTPHFVVPVDEMPTGPIDDLCRPVRHAEALGPEGANVNLVCLEGRDTGSVRTFERGVEAETLACGSGAMASALALHEAGMAEPELSLTTRGGDRLRVSLVRAGAERGEDDRARIRLSGPAVRVFTGRYPVPETR